MTTTDYISRELRRARLSMHRAEKKPNTPESEIQGLRDKIACLEGALEAVQGRDLARKPLTWEQLQKMDGKPVWSKKHREWFLLCIKDDGRLMMYDRNGFFLPVQDAIDYGLYSYAPPHLDRDAWEPCELCKRKGEPDPCYKDGCFRENAPQCDYRCDKFLEWRSVERRLRNAEFCPECGRPLTDAAWAELERRVLG